MDNLVLYFVIYTILTSFFFVSIIGYGKLFSFFIKTDYNVFETYKNLNFITGLIIVGFISLILNFFTGLDDMISSIIILIGLFFYCINFFYLKKKSKEIKHILIVSLIAVFVSFYTIPNDDFNYHFQTIINFKNNLVFDILHERRISYNSHWLLINSTYFLTFFPASIFIISSILYSGTLYDLNKRYKKNFNDTNSLILIYTALVLIFLVGVLNEIKEYGTDFTGQLILFYIIFLFLDFTLFKKFEDKKNIFLIILLLSFFSISIKISNALILIVVFLIFLNIKKLNINKVLFYTLSTLPIFFWMTHNYIISDCIIWPIYQLCFSNTQQAINEMMFIEKFAKGDITGKHNIDGLLWITKWFETHSIKILEVYGVYFVIILIPFLIFYFKNFKDKTIILHKLVKKINIRSTYFIFFIIIVLMNIIWFFKSPAYRFGVFYNLNLLLIIVSPLWFVIFDLNRNFCKKSIKYLLFFALIFFFINNFNKYNKYVDRYGYDWPNIIGDKLIEPVNN